MKSILISILFIFILTTLSLAQDSRSIQVNGGIISPMSSSKGLSGSLQFNHPLNSTVNLYAYTGYSTWDKYNVIFTEQLVGPQKQAIFKTYIEDEHILIPFYIGTQFNLHKTKFFTSFINVELGYSHLSYNSYDVKKTINPETGEVINYYPDHTTIKEVEDNLIGIGVGAGIFHRMTDNLNLVLSFRLNIYINSSYYGLFSTRGTYTLFSAGFDYKL